MLNVQPFFVSPVLLEDALLQREACCTHGMSGRLTCDALIIDALTLPERPAPSRSVAYRHEHVLHCV